MSSPATCGTTLASDDRRHRLLAAGAVVALMVLAALLRLREIQHQTVISEDAAYFLLVYRALLTGQAFAGLADAFAAWPPLYPLLTFATAPLTHGNLETAAHLVTGSAGVLLVPLIFVLGKRLAGPAVGLLAAGLAAVCPSLVAISGLTYGDMVYALLCASAYLGLVVLLGAPRPRLLAALLTGLALGLAYLCRPEALLLLVLALLWVLLARPEGNAAPSAPRRLNWAAAGLMLALFVLVAAPYGLALRRVSGTWQVSKLTYNLRLGLEPTPRPVLDPQTATLRPVAPLPPPAQYLRAHGRALVGKYIRNANEVLTMQLPLLGGIVLWALWGAGLVGGRLPWGRQSLALATMGLPLLALPLFIVAQLRFYAWLGPLFVLGAAAGAADLADRVSLLSGWPRRPVLWTTGALVLLVTALPLLQYPPGEPGLYEAFKQVGEKIRRDRGADQLILSEDCWVPFYAAGGYLEAPQSTPETLARYVARQGVRFVVVDTSLTASFPALRPLLDPRQAPASWRVFDQSERLGHYRLVVYEVARQVARTSSNSTP